MSARSSAGAYSIAPQTTANLRLVWVGVRAIEQVHPNQTANSHCKQWRLTEHGSVSFGWVQTRPEICGAIEYSPGSRESESDPTGLKTRECKIHKHVKRHFRPQKMQTSGSSLASPLTVFDRQIYGEIQFSIKKCRRFCGPSRIDVHSSARFTPDTLRLNVSGLVACDAASIDSNVVAPPKGVFTLGDAQS